MAGNTAVGGVRTYTQIRRAFLHVRCRGRRRADRGRLGRHRVSRARVSHASAGGTGSGASAKTLLLHWNGKTWTRTPNPVPATGTLSAIAATSAVNAWAVGSAGFPGKTLILHWNGKVWRRVPSPNPAPFKNAGAALLAVAAVSPADAWAVGASVAQFAGFQRGLILHWNGKTWQNATDKVISPRVSAFSGVSARSAANVWIAGCACAGGPDGFVIGHWNGSSWRRASVPLPANGSTGTAVAAASANNAWAIGSAGPFSAPAPVTLRWNGTAWKKVANPEPKFSSLIAVAAVSPADAWAVGATSAGKTLILHWNGISWK